MQQGELTDREQLQLSLIQSYTIADSWTFVRAEVSDLAAEKPRLDVISSSEYSEKADAATIAKILKSIVRRHAVQVC